MVRYRTVRVLKIKELIYDDVFSVKNKNHHHLVDGVMEFKGRTDG